MALRFATRPTTAGIVVVYAPQYDTYTAPDLERMFRRKGEVNLGHHFILHADGRMEAGIPLEYYAKGTYRRAKDCVYVMATSKKLNKKQSERLARLAADLNLEVVNDGNIDTKKPRYVWTGRR